MSPLLKLKFQLKFLSPWGELFSSSNEQQEGDSGSPCTQLRFHADACMRCLYLYRLGISRGSAVRSAFSLRR